MVIVFIIARGEKASGNGGRKAAQWRVDSVKEQVREDVNVWHFKI